MLWNGRTADSRPTTRPATRPATLSARQTVVLGAATALGSLSIDLYLPAFPELARELHASEAAVQLTLTACVIGLAVGQLVAGPLSDAVGRRGPIAAGLGAWALASFACALAPSIGTLTLLRLAQGLAGSAGVVVARAVVRDLLHGPQMVRATARLMLVVGVVPVAAPTVGGLLLERMSWRGLFVLLGCLGTLFTALVLVGLRESLPPAARRRGGLRPAAGSYLTLLRDARFLVPALVGSLAFAPLFIYVSSSSFVLREVYHLTPAQFGMLFGANSAGLVIGNQLAGALAHLVPGPRMLPVSVTVGATAAVLVLLGGATGAFGVAGVVLPLFVMVASIGSVMPVAGALAMEAHPERAGAASALMGLLQFTIGGVLAPLVGLTGGHSVVPLALLLAGCLVASLAVHALSRVVLRRAAVPAVA